MSEGCGDCKLCCKLLSIAAVDSPAGQWCRYARGKGCGIYPERPPACHTFECLWLTSQSRPGQAYEPALRPDHSGVVFVVDAMAMPDWLLDKNRRVLLAHCSTDRPNAWRYGLPRVVIANFLHRGGTVLVLVGEQRGLLRFGEPPLWGTEEQVMAALGVSPLTLSGLGMPAPILDFDELKRSL